MLFSWPLITCLMTKCQSKRPNLEVLKMHHLGIDENNSLEMPELELDEAKSLFLQHVIHDNSTRNEVANDEESEEFQI